MLMTGNREEAIKTIKTGKTTEAIETAKAIEIAGASKDSKWSKGEYLENFAQVPHIQYPIIF